MNNIPILPNTKSCLRFKKNGIVQTPKGNFYRLAFSAKRYKQGDKFTYNRGTAYSAYDTDKSLIYYESNVNKGNNKNSYRVIKIIIFKVKNNRLIVYKKIHNGRIINVTNLYNLGLIKQFAPIFKSWCRRKGFVFKKRWNKKYDVLSLQRLFLSYPSLENLLSIGNISYVWRIPTFLTNHLKHDNIGLNSLLKKICGSDSNTIKSLIINNKKDLLLDRICDIFILKKKLTVDQLKNVSFRKNYYAGQESLTFSIKMQRVAKKFIKNFHSDTIYNWLKIGNEAKYKSLFFDTLLMFNQCPNEFIFPNTNNIKEIHDNFVEQFRRIKDKPVSYKKSVTKYNKINNIEFNGIKIEIPEDSVKLKNYGEMMHNCIYGYKDLMKDGRILLLGIYKDNELKYNISINGKQIEQFYGYRNSSPEPEDYNLVLNKLKEMEIINDNRNI